MDFRFHVPVMLEEAVGSLIRKRSGIYVDGTLGGGGHAYEILKQTAPYGILIGIDADQDALEEAEKKLATFGKRKILIRENYSHMAEVLEDLKIKGVDGILLDLGVSAHQLETASKGFSFRLNAPLDMRIDQRQPVNAYDLVNTCSEKDLSRIIWEYGEERLSRKIAKAIVSGRQAAPIHTTGELAEIILKVMPPQRRRGRIHPATKTFQALRIAVNDELANLHKTLEDAIDLLVPGGRISIISFHSLEDRIIKDAFHSWEKGCTCPPRIPFCMCQRSPKLKIINRKPIVPNDSELMRNPKARSAKLRTAERI